MNIFVRILSILLAVAFTVLGYQVTIWVLGMLGVVVPHAILVTIFVILGLMVALYAFSGRFDNIRWFGGQ